LAKKDYYLEISSKPDSLPEVEDFLERIGSENNLDKTILNNLIISINEATTNGMMHGNKGDINKKVKISISITDTEIISVIKDEGKGFDPSQVPDPTRPENLFKESGRGLFIMNTCCKSVKYDFHPEGTELTLVMKL